MGITDHMNPWGPGARRRRRRRLLIALVAAGLVALVAVTVVLTRAVSGNGSSPRAVASPAASPAPSHFGIPSPSPTPKTVPPGDVLLLPPPARHSAAGVPLGFPRTVAGAVSAAVRWAPLAAPNGADRQLEVLQTIDTPGFFSVDGPEIRSEYAGMKIPANLWITSTPRAYRILTAGPDRVVLLLLLALQAGDNTGVLSTRHEADGYSMVWTGNDWRIDGTPSYPSDIKAPDPADLPAVRAAGWREFQLA